MRKLLLISICLFTFCTPALARQNSAKFETSACPFDIPSGETEGSTIECGMLTVPEDHNAPDGTQIQLAVAHIHSTSDSPAPDPVIYLSGGPGDSALSDVESWVDTPIRDQHDIILLDQRGTGSSQPALNCESSADNDATKACHDKLVADGVNLSDYNSIQSADDVADLRQALGYDEWNLLGISYGTRLSLVIMRDHPEGIRSVILDSVYPPQINDWEEYAADQTNTFAHVFAGCAADTACNQAYPDLEKVFYDTVVKLNDQPATYISAKGDSVTLSGDDLTEAIFQALYVTQNIPYLPKVFYEVSQGNYTILDDLKSGDILNKGRQDSNDDGAAGLYNSVTCSEELPFDNYDKAIANAKAARPELRDGAVAAVQSMYDTCAIWDVTPAPAIEAKPVSSAIPTLVLAGEYDPATPVAWSQDAAKTLSHSFFFEFPGSGHAVIDSGDCAKTMMVAFLADPTSEPDSSCIADMTEPQFVTK